MATNITEAAANLSIIKHDRNAHHLTESDTPMQATGSGPPHDDQSNPTTETNHDEPTMKLRSGRVVQKWNLAQAKLRKGKDIVGNSVRFKVTNPPEARSKPMSDVFNTAELLEQILLNLKTAFILNKAQLVCRGFKLSMDGSPTFRKRSSFAVRVIPDWVAKGQHGPPCSFNLAYKLLSLDPLSIHAVHL